MSLRTGVAALACAASLSLGALALAPAASAAPSAPAPAALVLPADAYCPAPEVDAAGAWLIAQWQASPSSFTSSQLAETIYALAAIGADRAVLDEMMTTLAKDHNYSSTVGGGAKVIIAAQALDLDPTNVDGIDLLGQVQESLAQDPSAGGIWNLPYVVVALTRAGATVPQAAIDELVNAQDSSGAYGWKDWNDPSKFNTDPDTTGFALTALAALSANEQGGQAVLDAQGAALAWLNQAQQANGSWAGYSPVNSTGVVISSLRALGETSQEPKAREYLLAEKARVGGMAFSASPDSTELDVLATAQGLFGLSPLNLYNLYWEQNCMTATPTPTATATPTPTVTATTTPAPEPTTTPSTTSTGTSSPASTQQPTGLPKTGR